MINEELKPVETTEGQTVMTTTLPDHTVNVMVCPYYPCISSLKVSRGKHAKVVIHIR